MDIIKLNEFNNYDGLNKFRYDSKLCFKDGSNMYTWFRYNKEKILSSNDLVCQKISKDYQEYKKISQINYDLLTKGSINITIAKKNKIIEFESYPSFEKFDPKKNILFKNGESMFDWFIENKNRILNSNDHNFSLISRQYYEYIKQVKTKQLLLERKYKTLFCSIKDLSKFEITSKLTFPDGMSVGIWFFNNENQIRIKKTILDIKIMEQYQVYLDSKILEKEFIDADLSKFDLDGCNRFSTGASMNFWWECMMEKILKLNDPISKKIQIQYKEYLYFKERQKKGYDGVTFIKK